MDEINFKFREEVLVRNKGIYDKWTYALYSHYDPFNKGTDDTLYCHIVCGGNEYEECIPYDGNEELLGTNKDYIPEPIFEEPIPYDAPVMFSNDGKEWHFGYNKENREVGTVKNECYENEQCKFYCNVKYIVKLNDFDGHNLANNIH